MLIRQYSSYSMYTIRIREHARICMHHTISEFNTIDLLTQSDSSNNKTSCRIFWHSSLIYIHIIRVYFSKLYLEGSLASRNLVLSHQVILESIIISSSTADGTSIRKFLFTKSLVLMAKCNIQYFL